MTIGEKIKDLRKQKNISMEELSSLTGISTVSICGYENGKHVPNPIQIEKLAKALDCSFNDLYNLK